MPLDFICAAYNDLYNPDEANGYLSNWYMSRFRVDNITFSSMEQYMMYRKACLFSDSMIANEVLAICDVAEIKALGRKNRLI